MKFFIVSEYVLKMIELRGKPVDPTALGRKEWRELFMKARTYEIAEGIDLVRLSGTNREGKAIRNEIRLSDEDSI